MKVGDLRRILANLPDDARVVVPGYDHSYEPAGTVTLAPAVLNGRALCEHYDGVELQEGESIVAVAVIE